MLLCISCLQTECHWMYHQYINIHMHPGHQGNQASITNTTNYPKKEEKRKKKQYLSKISVVWTICLQTETEFRVKISPHWYCVPRQKPSLHYTYINTEYYSALPGNYLLTCHIGAWFLRIRITLLHVVKACCHSPPSWAFISFWLTVLFYDGHILEFLGSMFPQYIKFQKQH